MTIKILVVVRWPLGGIRTYMRYMFERLPSSYQLKIIATSTQEDIALAEDVKFYKAKLIIISDKGVVNFALAVHNELKMVKYDLILSEGYVSAAAVCVANYIQNIPHILTVHGIIEPQYLGGKFGIFKRRFLGWVLSKVTVLYGVSNDILEHVYFEFPKLRNHGPEPLVILNGISTSMLDQLPICSSDLRKFLGLDENIFLFGFFSRFMPQKGFDLLIDAVYELRNEHSIENIAVVAVGSGDYLREYKDIVNYRGLDLFFHFLPFQPMVHHLLKQVDAVVMPSRWEACPLLPMEVLCVGTPFIASNCIGTREIIVDTPTIVFAVEDHQQLIARMLDCINDNEIEKFLAFRAEALDRFNVVRAAKELDHFIRSLLPSLKN